MSSEDKENVRQILYHNNYEEVETTLKDILEATKKYPELKAELNHFVLNNGTGKRKLLLSLRGSVPVKFEGKNYDLPVVIWLPKNYPVGDPQVFLTPTKVNSEAIRTQRRRGDEQSRGQPEYISQHGEIDFSALLKKHKLDCQEKSGCGKLVGLLNVLILELCRCLPASFILSVRSLQDHHHRLASGSLLKASGEPASSSKRLPCRLPRGKTFILEKLILNHYANPEKTANAIMEALYSFSKLKVVVNRFVHNNGKAQEVLLCLEGVLPAQKTSQSYRCLMETSKQPKGPVFDVPVVIWFPKDYPSSDIFVFTQFAKELPPQNGLKYFDKYVQANLFKSLHRFKDKLVSVFDLRMCVQTLSDIFGDVLFNRSIESCHMESDSSSDPDSDSSSDPDSDASEGEDESASGKAELDSTEEDAPVTTSETSEYTSVPAQEITAVDTVPIDGNGTKVGDLPESESPLSEQMETPSSNDSDSSTLLCLICEDPAVFIGNGCGTEDLRSDDDEAKQLMTLCKQMMPMNQDDIPKEIRREMFPLCASCRELVKELWDCQVRMEKIKATIEERVVEEVNLAGGVLQPESGNTGPRFIKLRSVIFEGYRSKLRLKKQERLATSGRATAASPNPVIIGGKSAENVEETREKDADDNSPSEATFCRIISIKSVDCLSSTAEQRMEVDEDGNRSFQLPCDVDPSVTDDSRAELVVKVEEEISCSAEEQEFGDPLFEEEHNAVKSETQTLPRGVEEGKNTTSRSLNVPTSQPQNHSRNKLPRTQEGTLLVGVKGASVKISWTRCLRTDLAFMECTLMNCKYSTSFGTSADEMNKAYKSMEEHIQQSHGEQASGLAKRFGKQHHFRCPYHPLCNLEFADIGSKEKHEDIHLTCNLCDKTFRKGSTYYRNPEALLQHKCIKNNQMKRNDPAGSGGQGATGNKKMKRSV